MSVSPMTAIDPERISQLSRRKLRGSASEDRGKDNHNLRRLVLIQNSLVSISPCSSPSRTSPDRDDVVCSAAGDDKRRFGEIGSGQPGPSVSSSVNHLHNVDDDGFAYVFPDLSVYSAGSTSVSGSSCYDEEDIGAESEWLDAVLSDLDDDDEAPAPAELDSSSQSLPITFHSPYSLRYQSTHGPTRVPLPSSPVAFSPPSEESDVPDPDALPYFDLDEGSSIDSDDSLSEPASPLSHSILRTPSSSTTIGGSHDPHRISVVSHSRHDFAHSHHHHRPHADEVHHEDVEDEEGRGYAPPSSGGLTVAAPNIIVNATSISDAIKKARYRAGMGVARGGAAAGAGKKSIPVPAAPSIPLVLAHQRHHQYNHDYLSCDYARGSYDSF